MSRISSCSNMNVLEDGRLYNWLQDLNSNKSRWKGSFLQGENQESYYISNAAAKKAHRESLITTKCTVIVLTATEYYEVIGAVMQSFPPYSPPAQAPLCKRLAGSDGGDDVDDGGGVVDDEEDDIVGDGVYSVAIGW